MADRFLLRVSAGSSYDTATHETVHVNSPAPLHLSSPSAESSINVRIQNYRGLPRDSPSSSPYFAHPSHVHDQYSISFSLLLKSPISGDALVFGNDFDRPIRDHLPPGFGKAFQIVKWAIDPGLDGDPYADKPHLYGPALSSVNVFRVGEKASTLSGAPGADDVTLLEEGGDGDGETIRLEKKVPKDAAARKKWFLDQAKRKDWEFEAGRIYKGDFFNPYLNFNEFSLKLPGFSLPILRLLDAQTVKSYPLRYVLKNRDTGEVYFVVLFTMILKEELEAEGSADAKATAQGNLVDTFEPQPDDVD